MLRWRSGCALMALESRQLLRASHQNIYLYDSTQKVIQKVPNCDKKCIIESSLSLWSHKPDNNVANIIQQRSFWLILNAIIDSLYDRNNGCYMTYKLCPYNNMIWLCRNFSSLSELTIITLIQYNIIYYQSREREPRP